MIRFTKITEGRVKCTRCGFEFNTASSLEKCFCRCDSATYKPPPPTEGPGTEFAALAAELGLTIPCGGCLALLADLNRWGPDECERRKPEILGRLRENEKHLGWGARLKAMSKAARKGYGSRRALLDEAIKRARAKEMV